MQNNYPGSDMFLPAIFFGIAIGVVLATAIEIPVLFLLKRMQGYRPTFFVITSNAVLAVIQAVVFILSIMVLSYAGWERMKAGASKPDEGYVVLSQGIFLLAPLPVFFVRRLLLALFGFRGNGAAWAYAAASTLFVSLVITIAFVLIRWDMSMQFR